MLACCPQAIEEKLEYWMEKYERDTEAKQQALNSLKSSRAADQAALQELAKQVGSSAARPQAVGGTVTRPVRALSGS